ncbi:MAG: aromatic acid exporter family protein [Eubacteriales bacterium]|nr:aromatic acid exporter family protein [Eubacteriales bacterium]
MKNAILTDSVYLKAYENFKVKAMNSTGKHMPLLIGMRTFKTALACGLAVVVGYTINSPYPPFLAIGALGCMDSSITASLRSARDMIFGNLVGAILAMIFTVAFTGHYALGCFIGVIIMITVCNLMHMKPGITSLACVVFCCCLKDIPATGNVIYGLLRFRDTAIGTGIALAVNMFIRPYSGANHTKKGIIRAQQAMLPLLEERVLRGRIPDLRDLRNKMNDLDHNINILLDERMNKSLKKSEVAHLRGCQQLSWKMRDALISICSIDTTPSPSPENLARMQALGMKSQRQNKDNILAGVCDENDTIVFNYYLKIFLDSNDYLTQLIDL